MKEITGRTLETIMAEANAKVDTLNKELDMSKRFTLEAEVDKLVKDYNELSLFTAYGNAKAQDLPIIALAKACTYPKIGKKKTSSTEVVEGVIKRVDTFSITESSANLNVLKFIKWLEDRNFKMPKDWLAHMSDAKANIIDQWQAFDKSGDEHKFKIGELKRLLQTMVNDMGFIKGENGNNALIVKGEHAKTMLKYSNRQTGVQSGDTLTPKIWDDLLLTLLNGVATGKAFENTYGGTAVFKEETAEAEASTEQATDETTTDEQTSAPAEATAQ